MLRNPLFAVAAVLTLATGAGAATAVFGVVDVVLLKPLPYPDAERLVSIWSRRPSSASSGTMLARFTL